MVLTEDRIRKAVAKRTSYGMMLAEKKYKHYCKGIKEDRIKSDLGILLENERRYLLQETTRGINLGDFQKYAFPLVRAIFPELVSASLVSVQPML